jgi:CPA1 family monovalent cation:H+ antiporter
MLLFELILTLLVGAVLAAGLAQRLKVPAPALLALGGAGLAFVPGAPRVELSADLALALFVSPVLLDAAYDASPRDLKDNWGPIAGLVIVAVGLTTVSVALVAHALVPGLSWGAAITLGAIVAPPDAAAATSVLRQVRLPHRLLVILEGESLLNDATALLVYRLAVAAVLAGGFSFAQVGPLFLLGVAGSIVVGPLLARAYLWFTEGMYDAPRAITLQLVGAFGVWILAEHLGLSGVLTMVAFAITIARYAPARTPAELRIPSYAVWETTVFVLNTLAFVLIGLQLGPILDTLDQGERDDYLWIAALVLVTVIATRFVWHMGFNWMMRLHIRRYGFNPPRPMMRPTIRSGIIISWCGMRGIVTLATALALPPADVFPHRDFVVLAAFTVVLGTLVLQGLTLRPLVRLFDLHDDDPVGREVVMGRTAAYRAALDSLDGETTPFAAALREELAAALAGDVRADNLPSDALRRRAYAAARRTILTLRQRGEIGDDAFHRLEEALDRADLSVVSRG